MIKRCVQCDKEFKIPPYRKDTAMFCSYQCKGIKERTGYKHTQKTKDKIRDAHIGLKASPTAGILFIFPN
jgi:hypothetical protein